MTKNNDDEKELEEFFKKSKLYLAFTNAGKPVYSK